MSEENIELPEFVEWRGMRFKTQWTETGYPHFRAIPLGGFVGEVRGIYEPDDEEWTWWISGPLGAGGKTFCDAMEDWHVGRLEAGDEARLIEESTCAPTKRTGEE